MTDSNSICNTGTFPFDYFDVNGNTVNGTLDNQGSCIFPDAHCDPSLPTKDCCDATPESLSYNSNYMFICLILSLVPYGWLEYKNWPETDEEKELKKEQNESHIPHCLRNESLRLLRILFTKGFNFYIIAVIFLEIYLNKSYQTHMTVNERNALMSVNVFMVPFYEIFQFIEDILNVRIAFALGRGDKNLTDQIVHMGIAGALLTGGVAGIVGTIIGFIPPALSFFSDPGTKSALLLYPGCEFIGHLDPKTVLPLWLFKSWGMITSQIGLAISGLMYGSKEMNSFGWIGTLAFGIQAAIWFTQTDISTNILTLMGLAEFCMNIAVPILAVIYLVTPIGSNIRFNTGVSLTFGKLVASFKKLIARSENNSKGNGDDDENNNGRQEQENNGSGKHDTKVLLKEGLKIMIMDVVLQGFPLITIYLALIKDPSVGYQITALQSELPNLGIAFSISFKFIVTIAGSQLLARGAFDLYGTFARISVVCIILFVPVIVGTVHSITSGLAFESGTNACEYAYDEKCVPFFNNVFGQNAIGGKYTLPFTFYAVMFGSSADSVFMVFRGLLLSNKDIDYLLYSTLVAAVCYIPAILVVTLYPAAFKDQAISYYICMNIPQAVLIFAFLPRILYNIRRMENGIKGPWSNEVQKPAIEANADDEEEGNVAANTSDIVANVAANKNDTVIKDDLYENKVGASPFVGASQNMTGTVNELLPTDVGQEC